MHKHINQVERYQNHGLLESKQTNSQAAQLLGSLRGTISHEPSRGDGQPGEGPEHACARRLSVPQAVVMPVVWPPRGQCGFHHLSQTASKQGLSGRFFLATHRSVRTGRGTDAAPVPPACVAWRCVVAAGRVDVGPSVETAIFRKSRPHRTGTLPFCQDGPIHQP